MKEKKKSLYNGKSGKKFMGEYGGDDIKVGVKEGNYFN